ncbi:MAG: acetyl-CoA carboxylase biotin carboxyl carrier protein subunit [Pyrinomonadaceae bacterium]|nr:acetyl-CoA carboxylase biotin carboxyl carrier protein subunit [Pyrinomonadaceae bacterium]
MKLTAQIGDKGHRLDVRREGERVTAEIDDRRYDLVAHEPEAGVYLFVVDGRVYECRVDAASNQRGAYQVRVGVDTFAVALGDPKRLRDAKSSGPDAGGRVSLIAPMPGKVVRVLVSVGAAVAAGDGLVVVEAMKMQNEMKSPKDGKVVEVHSRVGTTVNAGDVLLVVE